MIITACGYSYNMILLPHTTRGEGDIDFGYIHPRAQIAQRIQKLVEERQRHIDAMARIDALLSGVALP